MRKEKERGEGESRRGKEAGMLSRELGSEVRVEPDPDLEIWV